MLEKRKWPATCKGAYSVILTSLPEQFVCQFHNILNFKAIGSGTRQGEARAVILEGFALETVEMTLLADSFPR